MNEFPSILKFTDATGTLTPAAREWIASLVAELRTAETDASDAATAMDARVVVLEDASTDHEDRITALEP